MASSAKPQPQEVLEEMYASLPTIECQRKCQASCGPIAMSGYEFERMRARTPFMKLEGNELNIAPARGRAVLMETFDKKCPLLNSAGSCSVYTIRPLICRLFGLVEKMKCPFGCEPSRWVTDEEAFRLLNEAGMLG